MSFYPDKVKMFTLFPRKHKGDELIRMRYTRAGGVGPHRLGQVTFYTSLAIHGRGQWDYERNRVKVNVPGAETINLELDRIEALVLEAVDAGMNEEDIRELCGVPPVVRRGPRRKDAAPGTEPTLFSHQSPAITMKDGTGHRYKQKSYTPPKKDNLGPVTAIPDRETAALLARFGQSAPRPAAPAPAVSAPAPTVPALAVPAAPAAPAPVGFFVIMEDASGEFLKEVYTDKNAAVADASGRASQYQCSYTVLNCRRIAQVQVSVTVQEFA